MLRDYQLKAISEIDPKQNCLLVLPTGAGKTYTFTTYIKQLGLPTCLIAHRSELVGQMSLALCALGVRHHIQASSKTVQEIIKAQKLKYGQVFFQPDAPVICSSVDTLIRHPKAGFLKTTRYWVTDECFPAGTLIRTKNGGKNIQDIKKGEEVLAFNEGTGGFEYRKVNHLFKNPEHEEMIRLTTRSHHVIECTLGHPFWTQRGWVEAGALQKTDRILNVHLHSLRGAAHTSEGTPDVPLPENRENILLQEMWLGVEAAAKTGPSNPHRMYAMRGAGGVNFAPSKTPIQKDGPSVLQQGVLTKIRGSDIIKNHGRNEPSLCVGSNEIKKPYAQRIYTQESIRDFEIHRARTESSGRKRKAANRSRGAFVQLPAAVRFRGPAHRRDQTTKRVGVSYALQGGLSPRWVRDCNRDRRVLTCESGTQEARREENPISKWVGLESIEVYKPSGPKRNGDGYVYNIEVDELHTYVANGYVVHNCHHITKDNKWGRAVSLFPNATGLGVTATPVRGDKKGMGAHNDGVFTKLIVGPTGDDLIDMGYLSPYRVLCPEVEDLDWSDADDHRGANGEYVGKWLRSKTKQSRRLIGSIVQSYIEHAKGKRGITFCVDIEHAIATADEFKAAGVAAEVVTSKTPFLERVRAMERFKRGELTQLVNVDLFGEGVDVPDVEVISMGRKTGSFGLYSQCIGRALRPVYMPGLPLDTDEQRKLAIALGSKPSALIIDHVGNFAEHLTPTAPRPWTLDRPPKRKKQKQDPNERIKICKNERCVRPYHAYLTACPYCGHDPYADREPAKAPITVQGDLYYVDLDTVRKLQTEAARKLVGQPRIPANATAPIVGRLMRLHNETAKTQRELRDSISRWAGFHKAAGKTIREIQKYFFLQFDVDTLTAQTLNSADAGQLLIRVKHDIGKLEEQLGHKRGSHG